MRRSSLSRNEPQQRLCLTFSRGEEVKYISHLDMMRLWHRALRRSGMPLSYSQGFNPQPRIAIASPLAVEVTSDGELMDIFLDRKVSLEFFARAVKEQLPRGVELLSVKDVWPKLPSLQSQLRFAEYKVAVDLSEGTENAATAIGYFMGLESLPWEHARGEKLHRYDLRLLVDDIWIVSEKDRGIVLGMRLRSDPGGSGRPDQVLLALGFAGLPRSIHRTKLIMGKN